MYKYDFKLESADQNVGTVYLPNKEITNIPSIIYCHGWGGSRQLKSTTAKLCERTVSEGIAFIAFDFFGCGETGGDYSHMTYTRWKNNLSEIISWVISQTFADKNRIGCCAFSSGSTAALRLAAEDDRLSFIISVGTAISTHIGMGTGGPTKLLADNLESLVSGGTATIFGINFDINFYLDAISKAPIHTMDKINCPVLFLQGTADNTFRCSDAKMAFDLMKHAGRQATHIELDGGTHSLDNISEEAVSNVFDWLRKQKNWSYTAL